MKVLEKKEIVQVFEFTGDEVVRIFEGYLNKSTGIDFPNQGHYTFEVKIEPTTRMLEYMKITFTYKTNGEPFNYGDILPKDKA